MALSASPEGVLKALGATDFYPITSMCADYLLNRPAVVTSSNVVEIFSGLATLKYDGKHCYEVMELLIMSNDQCCILRLYYASVAFGSSPCPTRL